MTLTDALLPDESNLYVNNIDMENGIMVISVSSADQKGVCPYCQTISQRVHSSYQRQPADLPFAEYNVHISMLVRRFFCDNDQCMANTFAERIRSFIKPYARRTSRPSNSKWHLHWVVKLVHVCLKFWVCLSVMILLFV